MKIRQAEKILLCCHLYRLNTLRKAIKKYRKYWKLDIQ